MGCGCNKAKSSVIPAAASASSSSSVVLFDVSDVDGSIVASYESIVLARSEARRIGGTVVPRTTAAGGTAEVTEMSVPSGN